MSSEQDTLTWEQLRPLLLDRFVDHPKLPKEIRFLVLPLQEVRGHLGWRGLRCGFGGIALGLG